MGFDLIDGTHTFRVVRFGKCSCIFLFLAFPPLNDCFRIHTGCCVIPLVQNDGTYLAGSLHDALLCDGLDQLNCCHRDAHTWFWFRRHHQACGCNIRKHKSRHFMGWIGFMSHSHLAKKVPGLIVGVVIRVCFLFGRRIYLTSAHGSAWYTACNRRWFFLGIQIPDQWSLPMWARYILW